MKMVCPDFVQTAFHFDGLNINESVAENSRDISQCECPPSCRQVTYNPTLSGSTLSDMFINSLLTRSFWPDIQSRYHAAVDVQSRVKTESMSQMLQRLARLEQIYRSLSIVVKVNILSPVTSIVGNIYNAIECIVQQTHDSVEQFRAMLLQPFSDTYQRKVDFFVRRLVDKANAFLAHHASSDNGSFSNPEVNESATVFCQAYRKFTQWFVYNYRHPFKAATFHDQKKCSRWLINACKKFPEYPALEELMPEQTKTWRQCLTEFRAFLDDADLWLKTQETLNSSLPLQIPSDDNVLKRLINYTSRLHGISKSFRLQQITKVRPNTASYVC